MTDTWKSKGCEPDICIYGTFCNPCLFGENSSQEIRRRTKNTPYDDDLEMLAPRYQEMKA
jgi:hypothetical protein